VLLALLALFPGLYRVPVVGGGGGGGGGIE